MNKLPTQRVPKPTAWITLEAPDALLVGEKIGGKWKWECAEDAGFQKFNGDESPARALERFMKRHFDV